MYRVLLPLLTLLAVIANAFLFIRYREAADIHRAVNSWQPRQLSAEVGSSILGVVGNDLQQRPWILGDSQTAEKTLIFVYSSSCIYCNEVIDQWSSIAAKPPHGVRIAALNTSAGGGPAIEGLRDVTILVEPSSAVMTALGRLVPQTVLVDARGVVELASLGRLDDRTMTILSK
jgi:hypothetical protein